MKITLLVTALAAVPLAVCVPYSSAEDPETLTTINITANRFPTEVQETGSSVTTISAEELEKRGDISVLETLRNVRGLEIVQVGSRGRQASVFIRGNESDHTLVLIDGVRVNSNADGAFDFADLRTNQIDSIEVVRGAQSVLYGSEALGGVIRITTKKAAEGLNATLQAQGGSHGTEDYLGSIGWGAQGYHALLSGSYFNTDGISAAQSKNDNPEADGYQNISLSGRAGFRFLEQGTADLSARYFRGDTEVDGFAFGEGAVDDLNATQERDFFTSSLTIKSPLTTWLTPSLTLGYMDETIEGSDPDTEFNNFEIDNQTFSTDVQLDFTLFESNTISVGYAFEDREAENASNFSEERDVHSAFLQDQLRLFDSLFITAGVRYDDDSAFGDATTYRTTAAYLLKETDTRFHGSFGTGFKAPTFNELYFPGFGNSDLKEETSIGFDAGIEQRIFDNAVVLDVTYFQNSIDDLITFDTNTFLAANIDQAKIWGLESSASVWLFEWLSGKLTYTFTDAENETTGAPLVRRPRHRGTASLFLEPIEDFGITASFLLVNRRFDTDGTKMDNYERVDLAVRYRGFEHVTPFVKIENLFDESYEEIPTYGTPGFEILAGARFTL